MPPPQYEKTAASSGVFCCPQQRDGVCLLVGAVTDCVGSLTFSKGKQYMVGEWKNGRTHGKVIRDTGDGNKYVGELENFILYQNKAWFSIFSRGSLKIGLYFFSNRCTLWFP